MEVVAWAPRYVFRHIAGAGGNLNFGLVTTEASDKAMPKCVHPTPVLATRCAVPVATPHWDLLFNAVKDRLRLAAEASLAAAAEVPPTATELRLLSAVQACVEALEQLPMRSATLNPPQHQDHDGSCNCIDSRPK